MIVVKDVWKSFKLTRQQRKEKGNLSHDGKVDAVAGINFTCQPGRIFTLIGPNGAGKTTTLRMIATLLKPDSGSIEVSGFELTMTTALIPILNVSLATKAIIAETITLPLLLTVYLSLIVFAIVSIYFCSKIYGRESAIFR